VEIPKDAVAISESIHGYRLWRFPGNPEVIHDLREMKQQSMTRERMSARAKLGAHTRRHRNVGIQKENCAFCFPKEIEKSTAPDAEEK